MVIIPGTHRLVFYATHLTNKWAVALRGEYYSDENGVIIATGTTNGFKTIGGFGKY